jgi:hypothetical protein
VRSREAAEALEDPLLPRGRGRHRNRRRQRAIHWLA